MHDIAAMAKSAKTGRKASRSSKGDEILGYTAEGLPVWKPSFRPKSFTVGALQRAISEVRKREEAARAAG